MRSHRLRERGQQAVVEVAAALSAAWLVLIGPAVAGAQAERPQVVVTRSAPGTQELSAEVGRALVDQLRAVGRPAMAPPPAPAEPSEAEALRRAAELYANLRPDRAAAVVDDLLDRVEARGGRGLSQAELLEALLLQALAAQAQGETDRADEAIDRALTIDPELQPDPALYPPTLRAQIERRRAARDLDRRAQLVIEGAPAEASARVDGAAPAPIPELIDLVPGVHLLSIRAPGTRPNDRRLELEPGATTVEVELDPDPEGRLRQPGAPGAPRAPLLDAAAALDAELLLLELRPEGDHLAATLSAPATDRQVSTQLDADRPAEALAAELLSLLQVSTSTTPSPPPDDDGRRRGWIITGVTLGAVAVAVAVTLGVVLSRPADPEAWEGAWQR